jgi:hypothetical protein
VIVPGGNGTRQLACPQPPIEASKSVVFTDSATGRTTVTPLPLGPVAPAQLCTGHDGAGILGPLVDAVVPPTRRFRNHGDFVSQVSHAVDQILDALVESHVIPNAQAGNIASCLISPRARSRVGK